MILSIESSCDDSSIAITEIATKALIYHKKISQELEHTLYGGVVPELASRLHAQALPAILRECTSYFPMLKAVAVTNAPGLAVTLMEGVIMAKALSISLRIPLIGVHHLKGHIYSQFIGREAILPQTVLLISGGHTQLLEVLAFESVRIVASSSDDSFGESFDKVAKMMDLGYPGGPIIESMAREGDAQRFDFPVPLSKSPRLEFSYSGLKNAVRLAIEALGELSYQDQCDIAASFQKAATAHLVQKTRKYLRSITPRPLAIVGGASANTYVRLEFEKICNTMGIEMYLAPLAYCSDNAAMIGRVAIESYSRGDFVGLNDLEINPRTHEIN
ncbi:MAG: protein kinase [Sulfuricurvum sp. PC08-66]|nr:MAG: protein kinase [Sulfuricurvum sp. PC08-66]